MKIDHIGVAVTDLEKSIALYREAFRLVVVHREEVPSQAVRVAFLGDARFQGGARGCHGRSGNVLGRGASDSHCEIELLEPMGDSGSVARFISARGPGLHHVAFRSPALEGDMVRLRSSGLPTLEDKPRPGSRGHSICFIHPKRLEGVLVELVGYEK